MSGIVILGAGECGVRAAFAAREEGFSGPITIIGEEAGLPYERPPLSKPAGQGVTEKPICTADMLRDKEISLLSGVQALQVERESRRVTLSSGDSLAYDRLLFATGASPRSLACDGYEKALTFRTVSDARKIYRIARPGTRVVIVGAGLIGLELAAVLVQRDVHVSVLEYAPVPLGRNVPRQLAERIVERHLEAGVDIRCDVQVARITDTTVELADGRSLEAGLVVAAVGVKARTDLAEAAGVRHDNGICVDETLRTNDPQIFAAGDCASVLYDRTGYRRFETWQNAQNQGEVAGRNMAGAGLAYESAVWFWSDQFDLGLQAVGQTRGTPDVTRTADADSKMLFYLNDARQLVGAAGLGIGNAVAKDVKLAKKLIEVGVKIDVERLRDPETNLKKLLRPTAA